MLPSIVSEAFPSIVTAFPDASVFLADTQRQKELESQLASAQAQLAQLQNTAHAPVPGAGAGDFGFAGMQSGMNGMGLAPQQHQQQQHNFMGPDGAMPSMNGLGMYGMMPMGGQGQQHLLSQGQGQGQGQPMMDFTAMSAMQGGMGQGVGMGQGIPPLSTSSMGVDLSRMSSAPTQSMQYMQGMGGMGMGMGMPGQGQGMMMMSGMPGMQMQQPQSQGMPGFGTMVAPKPTIDVASLQPTVIESEVPMYAPPPPPTVPSFPPPM